MLANKPAVLRFANVKPGLSNFKNSKTGKYCHRQSVVTLLSYDILLWCISYSLAVLKNAELCQDSILFIIRCLIVLALFVACCLVYCDVLYKWIQLLQCMLIYIFYIVVRGLAYVVVIVPCVLLALWAIINCNIYIVASSNEMLL